MLEAFKELHIGLHATAFVLGSTRLAVFMSIAPFMGSSVTGAVRGAIVAALYCVLHPMMTAQLASLPEFSGATAAIYFGLLAKEVLIGFVLGWLAGMVFWAVEGAGLYIDNQRGATSAQMNDPLSGSESSPVGSFLFQSMVYAFFATGGFAAFMGLVYASYEWWSPVRFFPAEAFTSQGAAYFFGGVVATLLKNIVLISAPVVLACLFTDMALGLINRFASQLNVYVLAMPVKCAISCLLLIFYFSVLMTDASEHWSAFGVDLTQLRVWWHM